jgi:hypothetical protein
VGNEGVFCAESDPLAPRLMDFAFCDSPDDTTYVSTSNFVHFKRTPRPSDGFGTQYVLPLENAAVLHLSSLNSDAYQLKQAWYRVCERFYLGRSSRVINSTYEHTLPRMPITAPTLDFWKQTLSEYGSELSRIKNQDLIDCWHFKSIKEMFACSESQSFLNLQIWHLKELRTLYFEMYGRTPSPNSRSYLREKYFDRYKFLSFKLKEIAAKLSL